VEQMKVETLKIGDVEDPYLMAAAPIYDWQKTKKGRWIMSHAVEQPSFYCKPNKFLGYDIEIYADLTTKDRLMFLLLFV
jgi:hypothetical protein